MILFVNRQHDKNVGDHLSSPFLYFRPAFSRCRSMEVHLDSGRWVRARRVISRLMRDSAQAIIMGGGGLLGNPFFTADLQFWTATSYCPKILWGAGHNRHDVQRVAERDPSALDYEQLIGFDAIGLRDWGAGYTWVPCASCMHPGLHQKPVEGPATVFALHWDLRRNREFVERLTRQAGGPYEVIFNDARPEEFLGKLRNARAVVTNSYHAAYWGSLLGKRVVAIGGGTKIRLLKHPVVLARMEDWPEQLGAAAVHPHALEECCDANTDFCSRMVAEYGDGSPHARNRKDYLRDPIRERAANPPLGTESPAPAILKNQVPKIIHFIFGLSPDFGGKPFNILHHNAVLSVVERAKPEQVFFHYHYEPDNEWYRRIKPLLTQRKVEIPESYAGRPLKHFAHKADVLRLNILRELGGIYLDLDTVTVKPFDPILNKTFTMGIQGQKWIFGLCNAVMASAPNAPFIEQWLRYYGEFDDAQWDKFSVRLPYLLWRSGKCDISVEPYDRFHWPMFDSRSLELMFVEDHEFPNALCHHLWESASYEKYFTHDAPEIALPRLKADRSTYARLVRDLL